MTPKVSSTGLTFFEFTKEDAPLLVFLHGFPDNALVWSKQYEHFKSQYHILGINLPGAWDGAKATPDQYEVDSIISNLQTLILDKLNKRQNQEVIFIGHDLGAFLIERIFLPEKYDIKGYIHISGMDLDLYSRRLFTISQWFRSFYVFLFCSKIFNKLITFPFKKKLREFVYKLSKVPKESTLHTESPNGFYLIPLYKTLFKRNIKLIKNKEPVQNPTKKRLFIFGKYEIFLNIPSKKELDKIYSNATVKVIEGGHWLLKVNSKETNKTIEHFLNKVITA